MWEPKGLQKRKRRIRLARFKEQGGLCFYCGLPMCHPWADAQATYSKLFKLDLRQRKLICQKSLQCTAEHLMPKSVGGKYTKVNLVAACIFCNNKRDHNAVKEHLDYRVYKEYVHEQIELGTWHKKLYTYFTREQLFWFRCVTAWKRLNQRLGLTRKVYRCKRICNRLVWAFKQGLRT